MNRGALIVGALVSLPLLVLLALGFRSDPRSIESPLLGQPAPDFRLAALDGGEVDLGQLRGRPVVVNFWATWCQPCIVEHPLLQRAARQWEGRAHFVGIVYHDEEANIRRFLEQRGSWGRTLIDPDSDVAIRFGVYGAPETFVLDAEGIVRHKVAGLLSAAGLEQMLMEVSS